MKQTSKIFLSLALMSSLSGGAFAALPSGMAPMADSKNTFTTGDKTYLLNAKPIVEKAAKIRAFRASIGSTASRCARRAA